MSNSHYWKHIGVFDISNEAVCQLLKLPDGSHIQKMECNPLNDTFEVVVIHPDIPECPEGVYGTEVRVVYERVNSKYEVVGHGDPIKRVRHTEELWH